jgi:hypothetical protein
MAGNVPNLRKDVHETPRRHITLKLFKDKDKKKFLKAIKKKKEHQFMYKGTPFDYHEFFHRILQVKRQWDDIFKVLKHKTAS